LKILFVIPARGGSKGIPGKNIKPLGGKPLIHYSIEYARQFADDEDICLTTDDDKIIESAGKIGYEPPFKRPEFLATDSAGSYDVLVHAFQFYKDKNVCYDVIVLLQPTSPFRLKSHLKDALSLYNSNLDMVVSVNETSNNPYYNLFEPDKNGFLKISKGGGTFTRRQDVPPVYSYNGSLYIINSESLMKNRNFAGFSNIIPFKMDAKYSVDLDEPQDWELAEYLINKKLV
jgi:CMP-N,N'-diacetyllegionaminic acid synthase